MQNHDEPGGSEHFQRLRAAAYSRAGAIVQEIVAGSGGRTIHAVRSRTRTWPGTNARKPEPFACLDAEYALERADHAWCLGYIRLAREAGREWGQIGEAPDLHWEAVVNKEPISKLAYDCRPTPVSRGTPTATAAIRAVVTDYDARADARR